MKKKAVNAMVDIQGFQNFLNSDAFVALNLDPSEDGVIDLRAELKELFCVLVIAVDQRNVAHRIVPIATTVPPVVCRSLSLETTFANADGKFFVEKFTAKTLFAGDCFEIGDQASAEWRVIDSIDRLLSFYRTNHATQVSILDTWGLGQWGTFYQAEKVERWSKHSCHELNLFIFMKDAAFFEQVVKPFLESKMETGVVDLFLLRMASQLEPMLSPARFQQLNLLEQILVISACASAQPRICGQLAATIQARAAAKAKDRASSFKNTLLDSVLTLEQTKGTSEWVMADECRAAAEPRMASGYGPPCAAPPPPPMMAARSMEAFEEEEEDGLFAMDSAEVAKVASVVEETWTEPETTKEYAETQYYNTGQGCVLAPHSFSLSEFWADIASHAASPSNSLTEKLLSPNFIFATTSVHEIASAVALLSLPFEADAHNLVSQAGLAASFHAASPCVFVAKETVSVPPPEAGSDISVSVRVYRAKLD